MLNCWTFHLPSTTVEGRPFLTSCAPSLCLVLSPTLAPFRVLVPAHAPFPTVALVHLFRVLLFFVFAFFLVYLWLLSVWIKKLALADITVGELFLHILGQVHRLPLAFQASHGFQWSPGAACLQSGRPVDDRCHGDPSRRSTPRTPEVFVVESWRPASSFYTRPARIKVRSEWGWNEGT